MPDALPSEAEIKQEHPAATARGGAALLRARAADRIAAGRVRALRAASRSRTTASTSGSAPPRALPDDPAIHRCVLAYASDMTLLDTALLPHGRTRVRPRHHGREPRPRAVVSPAVPRRRMAALRPGQPEPHGARGFARGLIFTRRRHAGRLGRPGRPDARAAADAQTGLNCPDRGLLPADRATNPLNL